MLIVRNRSEWDPTPHTTHHGQWILENFGRWIGVVGRQFSFQETSLLVLPHRVEEFSNLSQRSGKYVPVRVDEEL